MKRERGRSLRMGRSAYKDTEMKTGKVLKCSLLRLNYKEQNPVQMALASVLLEVKGIWQEIHWTLMKNSSQKSGIRG